MYSFGRALGLAALAAALFACGADSSDEASSGSDGGGDAGGSGSGASGGSGDGAGDAGGGDAGPTEPEFSGTCEGNTLFPYYERGGMQDGGRFYYATQEPTGSFSVWYITAADGVGPGSYDLAGATPETCDVCAFRLDDCDASTQSCGTTVNALEGWVELSTSDASRLAGTLHNVAFGDAESCADGFTFNVGILPEEPARIGDEVLDFQLTNCGTGEPMSVREIAGGREGFWFIATAGWCPACRQFIPEVLTMLETIDPMTLDVAFVVGENNEYLEPDVEFCRRYAQSYGASPDLFFIDHDGTYSFATTFSYLWPYPTEDGAFGLPWNAIIDGNTFEYLYSDGAGLDLQATLDEILAP